MLSDVEDIQQRAQRKIEDEIRAKRKAEEDLAKIQKEKEEADSRFYDACQQRDAQRRRNNIKTVALIATPVIAAVAHNVGRGSGYDEGHNEGYNEGFSEGRAETGCAIL